MNAQKTMTARAWAELFLLGLIWGATFLSTSLALREVGVFTSVAFRVAGGAVVLWLFVLWRRYPVPNTLKPWAGFAVMGFLNNALPFSLITWGQLRIDSGLAAILNASTAIFGLLAAAAFFADERLTARKLVGTIIGFAGVVVAIGPSALLRFNPASLSQLAVLGAALSYGLAGVWARKTLSGVAPQVAAAGMAGFAALFMVPLAVSIEGAPTFGYHAATWAGLAYLALLGTSVAYLLYYRVLAVAGSANLMLVTLLLPPVAIALGALVLGERLGTDDLIGFALLALGLLVIDGRLFARRRATAA